MKLSKLKRTFYEDVLSSFTYKKDENKIILRIESSEAPNQFLGPFADPYFFLDKDEERIIRLEFLGVELIKKDRFKRDLMFDGIKVTSKKKQKVEIQCFESGGAVYKAAFKSTGFTFKYLYLPKKKQIELAKQGKLFYK